MIFVPGQTQGVTDFFIFAARTAASLYAGASLSSKEIAFVGQAGAFDEELIEKLCLKADDIWLKFMELMKGTRVVWARCKIPMPGLIENEQKASLQSENVSQNMNDVYFKNLQDYFNVKAEDFEIT